jgi:hypothetical protein
MIELGSEYLVRYTAYHILFSGQIIGQIPSPMAIYDRLWLAAWSFTAAHGRQWLHMYQNCKLDVCEPVSFISSSLFAALVSLNQEPWFMGTDGFGSVLAENSIGTAGAISIGEALRENRALRVLSLKCMLY